MPRPSANTGGGDDCDGGRPAPPTAPLADGAATADGDGRPPSVAAAVDNPTDGGRGGDNDTWDGGTASTIGSVAAAATNGSGKSPSGVGADAPGGRSDVRGGACPPGRAGPPDGASSPRVRGNGSSLANHGCSVRTTVDLAAVASATDRCITAGLPAASGAGAGVGATAAATDAAAGRGGGDGDTLRRRRMLPSQAAANPDAEDVAGAPPSRPPAVSDGAGSGLVGTAVAAASVATASAMPPSAADGTESANRDAALSAAPRPTASA